MTPSPAKKEVSAQRAHSITRSRPGSTRIGACSRTHHGMTTTQHMVMRSWIAKGSMSQRLQDMRLLTWCC